MTSFAEARDFLLAHRTDYAGAVAGFRWPDEEHFNFALDWFDGVLAQGAMADRPALRIVGQEAAEFTFREMSERSSRVANGLRALGLVRGDRLMLMLGNIAPLWEVMLAGMKLGLVIIPTTTLLNARDIADRTARVNAKAIICAAADAPRLVDAKGLRITVGPAEGCIDYASLTGDAAFTPDGPTRASDPLLLYFTSGTTSRPKLVLHSHVSYPAGHLTTMFALGTMPGDVHFNISSPGWAKHAYSCFFVPWIAGATVFICNQPRFDARTMLDAIVAGGVTSLCAPPTVWRMFIQLDLTQWKTALREAIGAGEPLNPEVIDQVRRSWGLTIRDVYGQTETTAQVANAPGQEVRAGSMGRPMPGYHIRLLDADGAEVTEGEICIDLTHRPVGLMQGYLQDDGSLAGTDGPIYRTGDVAARDADGYITYVGRADDVFKASDYRISPFELESALIEHPAVAEAAVVPAPDAMRLAVPKAYVVLAAGHEPDAATARDILAFCRTRLNPWQRIRRIEFADLPKTISGKIRRVELRVAEHRATERRPAEFRDDDFPDLKG